MYTSNFTAVSHDFGLDLLGREGLTRPLGWTLDPLGTRIAVWHRRQAALKPRSTLHLGKWRHRDIESPEGQCVNSHGLCVNCGLCHVSDNGLDETHDECLLTLECNGVAVLGAFVVVDAFDLLAQTDQGIFVDGASCGDGC